MFKKLLQKDEGFTLIEIVLVLAIAGLILLIVFLALSGAQRARRDTQRKDAAGQILSQFEQFASNHSGDYPTGWAVAGETFYATYISPLGLKDPTSASAYAQGTWNNTAVVPGCPNVFAAPATMEVSVNGRQVTVRMCLEAGFQDVKNF